MKSQFSKIAKIRKQKRDAIERELMKSQNRERLLQHKITTIYHDIASITLPKEGIISLLTMIGEQKMVMNREKKQCEQELYATQRQTRQLQSEYQKAHIEYEKIKYLEEEELKAKLEAVKRQEQLYLDEVSTMLFAGSKRGES